MWSNRDTGGPSIAQAVLSGSKYNGDWRGQDEGPTGGGAVVVWLWPTLLILTRGWWPVVLCGDTRVVYSTTTVSQWRAMTHRISVSVTQICNCVAALPCPVSIGITAFFPSNHGEELLALWWFECVAISGILTLSTWEFINYLQSWELVMFSLLHPACYSTTTTAADRASLVKHIYILITDRKLQARILWISLRRDLN